IFANPNSTQSGPPSGGFGCFVCTFSGTLPLFNGTLGNLTDVMFSINSTISGGNFTASVNLGSTLINSSNNTTYTTTFDGLVNGLTTTNYTGVGNLGIVLKLVNGIGGSQTWTGNGEGEGLTVTYTYNPVSGVPLPGALPLFASGLAGIGLTAWRSRR